MSQHPIPVVMCSSLTGDGSASAMKALECGAVDIITKPRVGTKQFLEESRMRICDAVKAAAQAKLRKINQQTIQRAPKLTADAMLAKPQVNSKAMLQTTEKVVVVGASTGGTEALREFLEALPADAPGVVIVQHMPEKFTAAFAKRLDDLCEIEVREAVQGDRVIPGRALIAPGGRHMALKRSGAYYHVDVLDGPVVNRHKPSVDVLFRSVAKYAGRNATGFILTGMGDDGARGLKEMHEAGARTLAQDEASCVVFGMPKEAIKLGGVDEVIPLAQVPAAILKGGVRF